VPFVASTTRRRKRDQHVRHFVCGLDLMILGYLPRSLSDSDSFPRLAAVEALQGEQDLARLAPKRGLIAAQPVEGIGRQMGQANKGACEIVGWICRHYGR